MSAVPEIDLVGRIAIAALLGGVIGYERDVHGRPVGLRTHLIVAMASATFMVVSTQMVYFQHYGEHDLVEVDASRVAASVVSGIGFLATGAILRTGGAVQGLTTAAGLWLVTAIGMSAGAGMYAVAVPVTAMGVVALTMLRRFEDKDDHSTRLAISVVLAEDRESLRHLEDAVRAIGLKLKNVGYERRFDDKRRVAVRFEVAVPDAIGIARLVDVIEAVPDVKRVEVQAA